MKRPKRIPALLLALALALGLSVPALAAGSDYSPTLNDFQTHFDLDISDGHNEDVDFRLLNWGYDESEMEPYYYGHWDEPTYVQPEQLTYYYQIPSDAVFTVANTAKGIDCKLTISMSCWSNHAYDVEVLPESSGSGLFGGVNAASGGAGTEMRLPEGDYLYLNTADLWLYKDKSWNEYIGYPPPEDLMLTLTPGQSCTFDLSEIHLEGQGMSALADPKNDNIYTIYINITYASGKRMYAGYVFHTGEKGGETRVEPSNTPQWHAPELPGYNTSVPSLFASTAKVTGFYLGDMDMGTAYVTITNPTDQVDAGVVAVALANVDGSDRVTGGDGVFFVPYEVAPGQSEVYGFSTRGIFNESMFQKGAPYAQQLASHVEATVFTFEDQADLEAFYQTIPYEQYWYPQGLVNEFQPICDGQPGDQWLSEIAGIHREGRLLPLFDYELPNGQRINAEKAGHGSYCSH